MENYKALKITNTRGNVNYIPYNRENVDFHSKWKQNLNREKQALYKIEEVILSIEEAAELGFSEAIQTLSPPAKRNSNKEQSFIVDILMKQNQELIENNAKVMERLSAIEGKNKTK